MLHDIAPHAAQPPPDDRDSDRDSEPFGLPWRNIAGMTAREIADTLVRRLRRNGRAELGDKVAALLQGADLGDPPAPPPEPATGNA